MTKEDLKKYDYYILVDRSTSMNEPADETKPDGLSRWAYSKELVHGVAREAAQYDDDGITLIFFAADHMVFDNIGGGSDKELAIKKLDELFEKYSPNGSTNTAGALQFVFDGYLKRKRESHGEAKPIILIVATDGRPDSEADVMRNIINFTKSLDKDEEAGIQFLQIGNNEGARAFLKKLDDDLEKKGAKFDIVDTKNAAELDKLSLTDILIEAVTD